MKSNKSNSDVLREFFKDLNKIYLDNIIGEQKPEKLEIKPDLVHHPDFLKPISETKYKFSKN